jgi:hypothetical protein
MESGTKAIPTGMASRILNSVATPSGQSDEHLISDNLAESDDAIVTTERGIDQALSRFREIVDLRDRIARGNGIVIQRTSGTGRIQCFGSRIGDIASGAFMDRSRIIPPSPPSRLDQRTLAILSRVDPTITSGRISAV